MEDQVREAILTELRRQSENNPSVLKVSVGEDRLTVSGEIDLDALAFVVVGAVAGGP